MTVIRRSTRLGAAAAFAAVLLWTLTAFGPAQEPPSRNVQAAQVRQAATPTPGFAVVNPANVQQSTGTGVSASSEPAGPAAGVTITATYTAAERQAGVDAALPTGTTPAFVTAPNIVRSVGAAAGPKTADAANSTSSAAVAPDVGPQNAAPGAVNDAELPLVAAGVNKSIVAALLVPTPTFAPVPTRDIPLAELIPEIQFKLPGGITPTPTPTPSPTPTPVPIVLSPGRLWSNFQPQSGPDADHFWIGRPFAESIAGQLASPSYQFGSTAGNRYRVHHGIDTSNPVGTPIRAATTGEVIHAGWDDPDILGPYGGFYGNAVVIRLDRRLPVAGGELDVFLLYGHMSEVLVEKGQQVTPDDIVGRVGMTGIAIGPHLHTEVRLGANTYQHSVNPYLWVQPKDNAGAVAVRLLTADGRTWAGARVSLARFDGGKAVWARQIETYMDTENIAPDPYWGENGAMGSVPPGRYYVIAGINGESLRREIDVLPGQTTFVELRTKQ